MASGGCLVQAVTPARASDAPISFRKLRRLAGLFQSGVRSANSSSANDWNSAVSASSSRLLQYRGPRAESNRARIFSRSTAGLSFGVSFIDGTYNNQSGFEYGIPRRASFPALPGWPAADRSC